MKEIYRDFLFDKHILVHDPAMPTSSADEVVLALMTLFAVRIEEGHTLADQGMIALIAKKRGRAVPLPFYRGFPESIKALSPDALLFDQLVHYTKTYGFGCFDEAGYSILERYIERVALQEEVVPEGFSILSEAAAYTCLKESIAALLSSSRPLNDLNYLLVKTYLKDDEERFPIASKDTAIRLLCDTRELVYAETLSLADVIKVVDYINYHDYRNDGLRDLSLKNRDRKFIAALIDQKCESAKNYRDCFEKKDLWKGLLHHLHYRPKTPKAEEFVKAMRQNENKSVYALFEKAMSLGEVLTAAKILKEGKGEGTVLRHLNYLLSRAKDRGEIEEILSMVGGDNAVILLQLLQRYAAYDVNEIRSFRFIKHARLIVHDETEEEAVKRGTVLPQATVELLKEKVYNALKKTLKGRVQKRVYLDPAMKKIALPLMDSATQGGYGVLPTGSRISIDELKKLRAFVYWEKVNDIDLSVVGFASDGVEMEFSWRNMASKQSDGILFSGDQTSGFHGGSEYFDIDIDAFLEKYPFIDQLVFTANVYSATPFSDCVCRTGYMLRDKEDSGEVHEMKTVRSAFTVNCRSTMAYLFGLDLVTREFVWLNIAKESEDIVAALSSFSFLQPIFDSVKVMNVYDLFTLMAETVTEDPEDADLCVSDRDLPLKEGAEQLHSYDYEALFRYLR